MVCSDYLNEIISHRRNAEQYASQLGSEFPAVARSDALYHGAPNVNVFVGAYANWVEQNTAITFKEFLGRFAPYDSESALGDWLKKHGFEVIRSIKGPKYAAFYSALEKAYSSQLANGKQPILIEHDASQLSILEMDLSKGERTLFVTADRQLRVAVLGSNVPEVGELMISHVGLIQFIQLLLGGVSENGGLTALLWSGRISSRSQAVRAFLTTRGLEEYNEGMAMAMPGMIERFADEAERELERANIDLETDDPKKRAAAFRMLGSLEKNYMSGMHEAVEKLRGTMESKP